MLLRILALLMVFYVMGFGDVRGSFVGISREVFGVSAARASLIPFFGALAFGLLALPAGLLAARKGKQYVIQLGLLVTVLGHLLPCLFLRHFSQLLLGIFVIGAGMTLLLVAGNPLMRDVGGAQHFARNLTWAQLVKALGSISGPYGIAFIVACGGSWQGIFPLMAGVAALAWLLLSRVQIAETSALYPARLRDILQLLKARTIRRKIVGMFLFVGSEMGMNTFLASHMWLSHGMPVEGDAIRYGQGLFWLAEGVGRLLGAVLLGWCDHRRFFLACALAGLLGLGGLILGSAPVAIASVALCGMSFSNIWPCLFTLILEARPHRASEIGGLTVMANLGGALLPWFMGVIVDHSAVRWGFLIQVGAFVYLVLLALSHQRVRSGTA